MPLDEDANDAGSTSEEEQIVVTRPEEQRDPEVEADFDREFAKMMVESMESRRFERKPMFDVPLPMRRAQKEQPASAEDSEVEAPGPAPVANTMKFSLLSKRGNRQQVRFSTILSLVAWLTCQTRSIDLPADSGFAVAMRSQREAERAEQQRIKNLVLNYDLRDDTETDGTIPFHSILRPNPNHKAAQTLGRSKHLSQTKSSQYSYMSDTESFSQGTLERQLNLGGQHTHHVQSTHQQGRTERSGTNRASQRARKLQLSDVDW